MCALAPHTPWTTVASLCALQPSWSTGLAAWKLLTFVFGLGLSGLWLSNCSWFRVLARICRFGPWELLGTFVSWDWERGITRIFGFGSRSCSTLIASQLCMALILIALKPMIVYYQKRHLNGSLDVCWPVSLQTEINLESSWARC